MGGKLITIPPSGIVPRLEESVETEASVLINGTEVPVVSTKFGRVVGLDPAELPEGALLIAGPLIAEELARSIGRVVYAPDTGPASAIRDDAGRIVAVRRLRVYRP